MDNHKTGGWLCARWQSLFPFLRWFPLRRETLRADLIAGLTVSMILIPQTHHDRRGRCHRERSWKKEPATLAVRYETQMLCLEIS